MTKTNAPKAAAVTNEELLARIADLEGKLASSAAVTTQSSPGQAFEVVAGNMTVEQFGNKADNPKATEGANVQTQGPTEVEDLSHSTYAILPDGKRVEVQSTAMTVERFGSPVIAKS